jgi:hypothetical protein
VRFCRQCGASLIDEEQTSVLTNQLSNDLIFPDSGEQVIPLPNITIEGTTVPEKNLASDSQESSQTEDASLPIVENPIRQDLQNQETGLPSSFQAQALSPSLAYIIAAFSLSCLVVIALGYIAQPSSEHSEAIAEQKLKVIQQDEEKKESVTPKSNKVVVRADQNDSKPELSPAPPPSPPPTGGGAWQGNEISEPLPKEQIWHDGTALDHSFGVIRDTGTVGDFFADFYPGAAGYDHWLAVTNNSGRALHIPLELVHADGSTTPVKENTIFRVGPLGARFRLRGVPKRDVSIRIIRQPTGATGNRNVREECAGLPPLQAKS